MNLPHDVNLIGLLVLFLWGVVFGAGFALGSRLMSKATG